MNRWSPWGVVWCSLLTTPALLGQTPTLTPSDYIEIEKLYARNAIGFDSAAEKGTMYARTYTDDGVLVRPGGTTSGRANLAALAARNTPGLHQWVSNLLIEPASGGATGWAYVIRANVSAKGEITEGGLYHDHLVKTAEGWRFTSRTYAPGHRMPDSKMLPPSR